jgi:hypothetical protein
MGQTIRAITDYPRANWHDEFQRPNETPLAQPWGVWGQLPSSAQLESNVIRFGSANSVANFGGWSYEHQPFTGFWGVEFDFAVSVGGIAAQQFRLILDAPWSKVGSDFNDVLAIDFQSRVALAGGPRVMAVTFTNWAAVGNIRAENAIPVNLFDGSWHTYRVWVDFDSTIRVSIDGALYLWTTIPSPFNPSPGRRAANFGNGTNSNLYFDNFELYDREYDILWTSQFYDDFNRTPGPVGNGWTQVGANAAIQSSAWATTGTTDGGRAILRDTSISNGRMRVEGTLSANPSNTNNADNRLILCGNSTAGTQGLVARINGDQVRIARFSSALSGNPPTFTQLSGNGSLSSNIVSGNKIGFSVRDGYAWIDRDGEVLLFAGNVHSVVPSSNRFAGAGVARFFFADSAPWNDLRILQAA